MARRLSQVATSSRRLGDSTAEELRQLRELLPELCEDDCNREYPVAAPSEVLRSPLVLCRFRAQSVAEESKGFDAWELSRESVIGKEGSGSNVPTFAFDHVFGPEASQEEVYQHVERHIHEVLQGINCAVLCYGQTSAGKTYTMVGPRDSSSYMTWGIVPRTLASFFEAPEHHECQFRLSMLEIYMERLIDLLNPKGSSRLRILEDQSGKVVVQGLYEARVSNYMEALAAFWKGQQRRTTATTGLNDLSSRSHCIFVLTVERSGCAASKLYLVDLAGSESIKKAAISGADQDFSSIAANMELSEESKAINQSLSTLGLVLNRLAERRRSGIGSSGSDKRRTSAGFHETHIPYRSSKLTRVLQDVFSGNARIALIVNCSISSLQAVETLSTLRFGRRARLLTTTVKPIATHEPMPLLSRTLKTARQEIQRLRRLNADSRVCIGASTPPAKRTNCFAEDGEEQDSWLSLTPIPHSAPPAPALRLPLSASGQVPSHFDLDSSTCWSDLTPREPDNLTPVVQPRRLQFFPGMEPSCGRLSPNSPSAMHPSSCSAAVSSEARMSCSESSCQAAPACWEYPMTRRESSVRAMLAQQQICSETVARLRVAEAELEWVQWLSPGEADLLEPALQVESNSDESHQSLTEVVETRKGHPDSAVVAHVALSDSYADALATPNHALLLPVPETEEDALFEPNHVVLLPVPETEEQKCPEMVPEVSFAEHERALTPELVPEVVSREAKEDPQATKDVEEDDLTQAYPIRLTSLHVRSKLRSEWLTVPILVAASACALGAAASWM